MREKHVLQAVLILLLGCFAVCASAQDEPSLGDAARQARQQKNEAAQSRTAAESQSPKVITNEEIPEQAEENATAAGRENSREKIKSASGPGKLSAEQWKARILAQKNRVTAQQVQIQKLNDSIRFAWVTCERGCVQWNERQVQKQQEVERMKAQLEGQKQLLYDMQESARKQGYGNSVYEP